MSKKDEKSIHSESLEHPNLQNNTADMRLYTSLFNRGKKRALEGGALEPEEGDLKALADQAEAAAKEVAGEIYDPKNHPHDRIREEEYKKNLSDRKETEKAEKHSGAKVRDTEDEEAKVKDIPERPEKPLEAIYSLSFMIALTLVPTIHDRLLFNIADEISGWTVSGFCSLVLGFTVAWSIAGFIDATGEKSFWNWAGFLGGVATAIGFGMLRLADAQTDSEIIFSISLSVVELSAVIFLEFIGQNLRKKYQVWHVKKQALDKAQAILIAAQTQHQRLVEQLSKINQAIKGHLLYVETKTVRNTTVDALIENSIKSCLDGYAEGLAINRGKILGITPENEEKDDEDEE